MNKENLAVLTNVIGAVESGGQVYGQRRYDAYADPYTNTPNEHTITLGWAQNYGPEAKKLIKMIYDKNPTEFKKLDTCSPSIESMLNKDWVSIRWKPNSSQKKVLIKLISSNIGKECQDELFMELMQKFISDCAKDYTKDIKAQMMYCEIRHLGGKSAADRIFKRCNGNYSLENIMAALVGDQRDKSSDNQVGDAKFWSRHVKCNQFISQYAKDEGSSKKVKYDPKEVIKVAEAEVGYLEKKSNYRLDEKTANAGNNNFTKYGRDLYEWTKKEAGDTYGVDYQWCDQFVDWCFVKAYGIKAARELLGGWSAYTPTSAQYYKNMGRWSNTPQYGSQIFFHNAERICHTGLVYKVTDTMVYTIEGNTSDGVTVIPNGGSVCKKSYARSNSRISGYGMPKYNWDDKEYDCHKAVYEGQKWLNNYYGMIIKTYCKAMLVEDGEYGPKSRAAALAVWKDLLNRKFKGHLTPGNTNFGDKCKKTSAKAIVKKGSTGTFTLICQFILAGKGYYSGPMNTDGDDKTIKALKSYQKAKGLKVTGECDPDTWYSLFN